jgi:hypothetical protein
MLDYPTVAAIATEIGRANFGSHHVLRAIVEPWSDWVGNDAFRVTLVITPEADLSGDAVINTSLKVSDRLLHDGEERRAFIFYATEDELAVSGDPES